MNRIARARLDELADDRREILVVDDEEIARVRLRRALEEQGFRVRVAESGERALDEIQVRAPDLVVLDRRMGAGLDGNDVCRAIKSSPRTSSIPVIMLTAVDGVDEKVEALRSGANDYVTKRQDLDVVPEVVVRVKNQLDFRDIHRDSSPLTQLPGNAQIERELRRRVAGGIGFTYLYADIDGFKEFNDLYGHQRGDECILATAELLRECLEKYGQSTDFIGHVGGDDFVILCAQERAEAIADAIVRGFDAMIVDQLDAGERERGYIEVQGRTGRVERHRLTSLTIAAVNTEEGSLKHPGEVSARAAEIKRNSKARARRGERGPGSHVAWERRALS